MLQSQVASAPAARPSLPEEVRVSLVAAAKAAGRAGSEIVSLEHLALGLLDPPTAQIQTLLAGLSADVSGVVAAIKMRQPRAQIAKITVRAMDEDTRAVLSRARAEASRLGAARIDNRHILLAILADPTSQLSMSLRSAGLTHERVAGRMQGQTGSSMASVSSLREAVHLSTLFLVLIEAFALTGIGLAFVSNASAARVLLLGFIVSGWVISLCLHEFGHAAAAFLGGDTGVVQRGTLTIDPRRYTHPLLSIVLPLAFLAMGGIALPGGAVKIDRSKIRSTRWNLIVSLAGPAGTLLSLLVLCLPFMLFGDRFVDGRTAYLWTAMAGLALVLVFVLILNLLPIPPLDGFRALSSWLPPDIQQGALRLGWLPVLAIYVLLASPNTFSVDFWHATSAVLNALRVPGDLGAHALSLMQF